MRESICTIRVRVPASAAIEHYQRTIFVQGIEGFTSIHAMRLC